MGNVVACSAGRSWGRVVRKDAAPVDRTVVVDVSVVRHQTSSSTPREWTVSLPSMWCCSSGYAGKGGDGVRQLALLIAVMLAVLVLHLLPLVLRWVKTFSIFPVWPKAIAD